MMTTSKRVLWLMALLALVPPILYAYLGSFSRMIHDDDYGLMLVGQEMGAWEGMLWWYNTWTGTYTRTFLVSALAPLDSLAPRLMPALIILLWLGGTYWLVSQGLAYLGISRLRRPLALSMSALSVAAAIYAFYSPQSFYWYTASIPYALPLALLTIYMALAIRMARRWRKNIPSLLGAGVIGFLVAGFSEMYLIFQLTLFTFCLLMSLAFLGSSVRSRYAPLIGAGWLGTLASLLVQLSSPGGAIRAEVIVNRHGPPDRSASHLLFDTLEQTFGLARHAEVFVGLMMLMGVGLLVMLIAYQPPSSVQTKTCLPSLPLWLGLIFQLLFIPLLWSHTSDNPQLLGRFSIRYMTIITLNIISILGFLVMLWQRGRINTYLQKRQRGWLMAGCIMAFPCLFALLFFIPQIRNIDYRAAVYLFTSVHVLLAVLTWQLSSILESAAARGLGLLALGSYGIGWASITAIIFAANFATPWTVFPRTLSASAWLLVFSGLIWGVYMGYSAQCLLSSRAGQAWARLLKLGSFAAVLVIAAGILGSQVALAPDFQLYAQEWEEFHQEVIAQRDSGKTVIEVEPFTFDLAEYLGIATLLWGEYDGAEGYYKVESIAAKDS